MNNITNQTILVTGGSGFIGSNLCDRILEKNPRKLIILDNLSASNIDNIKHILGNKRVEFIKGDIRDYEVVDKLVRRSNTIFHLAASNVGNSVIFPQVDAETNIIGTLNILRVLKDYTYIRMVHVSSGSVINPSTPYAVSKATGENYCNFFAKEYGLRISVVRPFHIFGERQDMNGKCGVVNIFLSRILKGLQPIVWGTGDQIKCFTYVWDLVSAILRIVENEETVGKIYDVASDTRISIKDLASLLIQKYAQDNNMSIIYDEPKIGENAELFPDTKAIKDLGWKTTHTFEEGLILSSEWVKQELNK